MISPDEQTFLWADAYNAALSGLLARKMDDCTQFSANNVHVLTDQCKAFADQALTDALKLKTSSSGAQWAKKTSITKRALRRCISDLNAGREFAAAFFGN